ncbi:MAG: SRPBCC family protein [Ornithinimicrobium sp.]|uniref:SRPBCC family protein n=1 Tax=Ornithinimicrobium sp. TaxID=1977084 RepID=UPI0026E0564B|nr:SRPBCC family protein [Ornithinimicrobium sp.]MDO5739892.1 SRPBCC family protein [Ornithinimicrobium sp.]
MDPTDLQPIHHCDSTRIAASPGEVYDVVSDITRTGEWSVVCRSAEWADPEQTGLGAKFVGHNQTPHRVWSTTSTVVAAEPGEHFAWEVSRGYTRWGYRMSAVDGGTELVHEWAFLPAGQRFFERKYGADAQSEMEERTRSAHESIPRTLAAIKAILEG